MQRKILTFAIPPMAVCRYGCAGCCAAPIGVFWVAGLTSIIYGFLGGPAEIATTSWSTVLLGVVLWGIASVWAMTTIRGVSDDKGDPKCSEKRSTVCRLVTPKDDDNDPMDEAKKIH